VVVGGSFGELTFKGRVQTRLELLRRREEVLVRDNDLGMDDVWISDVAVDEAQLSLSYVAPERWLHAEVSVDVAGKPRTKDAFVEAESRYVRGRVGQFKVPTTELLLASSWELASGQNDLIETLLVDRLQVGGRRPGVAVTARAKGGLEPQLTLGAFQGSQLTDEVALDTSLLEAQSLGAQSVVARLRMKAGPLKFGGFFEERVATVRLLLPGERPPHYWTAGAELSGDMRLGVWGVRLWSDALAGRSWFEASNKPAGNGPPRFFEGRALLGVRHGGAHAGEWYVEPHVMAGLFDPDLKMSADLLWEGLVGVAAGGWERWRVALQGTAVRVQGNFPADYRLQEAADSFGVRAQAGVAF